MGETLRVLNDSGIIIVEAPWKNGPYNFFLIRTLLTNRNNENKEPMNLS